jgi:hypothetical protein
LEGPGPDRFHVAVPGLARTLSPARQGGPGRLDRIGDIGLAGAATGLAVRPVDLDHLDPTGAQEPGQARPVGAGAFDTDEGDWAERAQPAEQLVVAGGGRLEALHAQQPADVIDRGGHVDIEVGVDSARDRTRAFYDGHRHPFSLVVVKGWHAPPTRVRRRCDRPVAAG